MFERHNQPLASTAIFVKRIIFHGLMGSGLFIIVLGVGIMGYHRIAHLAFIDAFLNATMVLCGMGQINTMYSVPAKLFASIYALFCGLMFATALALIMAPIIHRFLHRFNLKDDL